MGQGPGGRLLVCVVQAGTGQAGNELVCTEPAGTVALVAQLRTCKRQRGSRSLFLARWS
jgi:hypothetical protein